jgi:signal transduction histidine kinase/ActR/RegA family two-component response regulator
MSTMQDITALKWHEARLAENVELLRVVVQGAPIVLLSTDRHGRITLSEGSALSLFDQKPGQAVGQSVFQLYRDVEGLVDGIVRALGGERTQIRVRLGELWFDAVFAPRLDASGAQTGVIGVAVDVTERLRLEEELLQSQKMQAIGLLAGGVAHDFNNVLTVILAHASLLLERAGDDTQRRGIETVLDAARRAEGLTRQLLLFSRREVTFRHPLDVSEVVRGTTRMLSRLIGEDVKVRTRLIAGAPQILADKGQVEQVLMNLVVNARDAMPRGGELVIEAGPTHMPEGPPPRLPNATPGDYAFIRVSDTGTGMDEKTRGRIFEPFFTTKAPGRGTGLGLSTVYGIVERSGGHIHVESEVGIGTTFWVLFPAHAEAPFEAGDVPPSDVVTPRRAVTILLVEDEREVRRITERCLREAGHQVFAAATASDALRLAAEHEGEIELLLSDVVMPEMSGPVLAGRLRERIPGLRILFITGYTDDTALRYGVDQNLVELLSKPFTPDELSQRVSRVMADEVRPEDDMLRSWAETSRTG